VAAGFPKFPAYTMGVWLADLRSWRTASNSASHARPCFASDSGNPSKE
jgi:hypothetical protein